MINSDINSPVDLSKAYELAKKYNDKIRIYPGSMEIRERQNLRPKIPRDRSFGHRRQHRRSTPNQSRRRQSHHRRSIMEPNRHSLKTAHCQKRKPHGAVEEQSVKRIFVSDCEGPISKNDNAYELAANFIPNGDSFFCNVQQV